MQAASGGLTDSQIASMISSRNADTSIRLFELLPQFVQGQDQEGIIQGFFEAVQEEYERNKSVITDIYTIIDPHNVGRNYTVSGNFVFFHPEQFVYGGTPAAPNVLVLDGATLGVAASGFYNDFGIYVWEDTNLGAVGQYRIVTSYDGTTRAATLDEDWEVIPSTSAVYALCWPDRVWLPTPVVSDPRRAGATVFPVQNIDVTASEFNLSQEDLDRAIVLPGLSYLSTIDDYYTGWVFDFLDGRNAGRSSKVKHYRYRSSGRLIVLEDTLHPPDTQDWFRIVPPEFSATGISNNFYKDRWLHVVAPTAGDITYGQRVKAQARQIISSVFDPTATPVSHVAYVHNPVTSAGQRFKSPPPPTANYGISNTYIPLQYLAEYVGIELDEEDAEIYQREQISQAYSFHRLKGTRRALELVCRSFGMDVLIDEAASNYTHAPTNEDTGPFAAIDGNHVGYPGTAVTTHILTGAGLDDVPDSYLVSPGREDARIQDSDIRLYLSRNNLNVAPFNINVLTRILRKLSPHIPIHVQIIFVGLLTRAHESVATDESMGVQINVHNDESFMVAEGFLGTPIGEVPISESYPVKIALNAAIRASARYSRMTSRYGRNGVIPALTRWSNGTLLNLA